MSREKSSTSTRTKNKTSCRVCLPTIMSRLGLCPRCIFFPLPLPHSPRVHCHHCVGPFLWIKELHTLSARNPETCYPGSNSEIRSVYGSVHHCEIARCLSRTLRTGTQRSTVHTDRK